MPAQHRIVVAHHRPWLRWSLVAGGTAALALGAWVLYSYSRASAVSEFERAQVEADQVRAENRDLSQRLRAALTENQGLKSQLAYESRSQQIDASACAAVKQSLATLQAQSADLTQQLSFYRGIVAPGEAQSGVRVFEFQVTPAQAGQPARYHLVLIQSKRSEKRIDGKVSVRIEGQQGGQKRQVSLGELATDGNRNLLFSFKYFQEFSGSFRLPEGFRPVRATVVVDGDGVPEVDDDFDWAKIEQETSS